MYIEIFKENIHFIRKSAYGMSYIQNIPFEKKISTHQKERYSLYIIRIMSKILPKTQKTKNLQIYTKAI